jgi:copper chaperone CopZ
MKADELSAIRLEAPGFSSVDTRSWLNLDAAPDILCPMMTTVSISGMSCAHCVRAVFTSLAAVPGIKRADVSIGQAIIEHDGTVTPEQIRDAIAIAGYTVGDVKNDRRTLPLAP